MLMDMDFPTHPATKHGKAIKEEILSQAKSYKKQLESELNAEFIKQNSAITGVLVFKEQKIPLQKSNTQPNVYILPHFDLFLDDCSKTKLDDSVVSGRHHIHSSMIKRQPLKEQCQICNQQCTTRCERCKEFYYCCKQHQKQDWKQAHKYECFVKSAEFVHSS
jgi:hypothetical protein